MLNQRGHTNLSVKSSPVAPPDRSVSSCRHSCSSASGTGPVESGSMTGAARSPAPSEPRAAASHPTASAARKASQRLRVPGAAEARQPRVAVDARALRHWWLIWLGPSKKWQLSVVWQWATYVGVPQRVARILRGHFAHERRVMFENNISSPTVTVTAILPGSDWSFLLSANRHAGCYGPDLPLVS